MQPKLTDILELKNKFYEFYISPFFLNNAAKLIIFLLMFLIITLLIVIALYYAKHKHHIENNNILNILIILSKIFKWRLILILYLINSNFISLYS